MTVRYLLLYVAFLIPLVGPRPTVAQVPEPAKQPVFAEMDGTVTIAGKKIGYKSTAGMLPVKDMTGKAKANIFFMAYTKKTDEKPANRPLMFCFNGGPGTSSAYVHLGFFGPRRVVMNENGLDAPRPVQLIENDCSMLDVADLVLIDPVSTGLSRAEKADEAKLFHGLEEDTSAVGDFIKAYVTKYERSESPTYIAGESYGTTRASSLSSYVQSKGGVKLAGIILISAVLNFQASRFEPGNDLPYSLFLPTYTASAWHHGKLDPSWASNLETALKEAQRFADGPYVEALHKGNLMTEDERKATAKQVAKYTGLTEEFVLRSDLRVEATRFRSELLRDKNQVIGRLDTRVAAKSGGGGEKGEKGAKGGRGGGGGDPSNSLVSGVFGEAINKYVPENLGYKTDIRYQLSGQVQPWNYSKAGTNRFANVAPRLRSAMEKDSKLRVLVASGYCDLATPFSATNYTFAHLGPRTLTERVTMTYYDAGHMMYTHEPSRRKLREDLVRFITSNRAGEQQK